MNKIENKVALVTGANRGIGRSIVENFLNNGAKKVYAAARNTETLSMLQEAYGDRLVPLRIDLNQPETVKAAAQDATDVEVLVNNAGMFEASELLSSDSVTALQKEMEVNVYGLIRVADAFATVLKSNGGGALIQLNSVASLKNFPVLATYSASKAASYSITQALKELLGEQGTQVISVHPGPIATDMASDAGMQEIAEPVELVPQSILASMESGDFHVYPDSLAKQFGEAYRDYATGIVEAKPLDQ